MIATEYQKAIELAINIGTISTELGLLATVIPMKWGDDIRNLKISVLHHGNSQFIGNIYQTLGWLLERRREKYSGE